MSLFQLEAFGLQLRCNCSLCVCWCVHLASLRISASGTPFLCLMFPAALLKLQPVRALGCQSSRLPWVVSRYAIHACPHPLHRTRSYLLLSHDRISTSLSSTRKLRAVTQQSCYSSSSSSSYSSFPFHLPPSTFRCPFPFAVLCCPASAHRPCVSNMLNIMCACKLLQQDLCKRSRSQPMS